MKDFVYIIENLLPNISLVNALTLYMLVLTRWLVMTLTMPFLGSQLLPAPIRLGLAAMLSVISFVLLVDHVELSAFNTPGIVMLFFKEAFIGFILGFLSSLIFFAYELAGELVDFSRAANMARLLVPELKHQSSALGTLLFQLSLVVFVSLGFHRQILSASFASFITFPVDTLNADFVSPEILKPTFGILASLFETAVKFALPIIVVSFLVDLAFGLMNRVAPQINAYFLSLPAKMLGGLIMMFLIMPFLLEDFHAHYQEMTRFFHNFLRQQP